MFEKIKKFFGGGDKKTGKENKGANTGPSLDDILEKLSNKELSKEEEKVGKILEEAKDSTIPIVSPIAQKTVAPQPKVDLSPELPDVLQKADKIVKNEDNKRMGGTILKEANEIANVKNIIELLQKNNTKLSENDLANNINKALEILKREIDKYEKLVASRPPVAVDPMLPTTNTVESTPVQKSPEVIYETLPATTTATAETPYSLLPNSPQVGDPVVAVDPSKKLKKGDPGYKEPSPMFELPGNNVLHESDNRKAQQEIDQSIINSSVPSPVVASQPAQLASNIPAPPKKTYEEWQQEQAAKKAAEKTQPSQKSVSAPVSTQAKPENRAAVPGPATSVVPAVTSNTTQQHRAQPVPPAQRRAVAPTGNPAGSGPALVPGFKLRSAPVTERKPVGPEMDPKLAAALKKRKERNNPTKQ